MNIAKAIAAAARAEHRYPVTLSARESEGATIEEVAWFVLRKPDSLATARAGAATLLPAPGVLPPPTGPKAPPNPIASLDTIVGVVCASVVGVSRTEAGEVEPLTLVLDQAKADPDAGRVYFGDLPPRALEGLISAAIALVGEGGNDLSRFLAA